MAFLRIIGSDSAPRPLTGDTVTIGRGATNDIVLSDSACSSRHAQLVCDGEGWRIEDRGSLNKTFVNGQEVPSARLKFGDRIRLGSTELVFESEQRLEAVNTSSFLQSILADDDALPGAAAEILEHSLMIEETEVADIGSRFEFVTVDAAKRAVSPPHIGRPSRRKLLRHSNRPWYWGRPRPRIRPGRLLPPVAAGRTKASPRLSCD